jgi:uncharacterized protein YndB with AHSA1/START domain
MITVRDHIDISASAEAVFSFLDAPARQPEITPSLTRSTLVERLPNGGSRVEYTYRLFGFSFTGEVRATDYVPSERIVWAMSGDLRGSIRWYVAPREGGTTRFTYAATYAVPGPALLRRALTPLVRRYNEREVRTILETVRTRLESKPENVQMS